jgi:aerobic-type carbon monoxide dehydrogenase small subunit (CoxS/CutS family)
MALRPCIFGAFAVPRVKSLLVNGSQRSIDADAETPLLYVLRDQLDLTGTKYGCGEGQCGACTVLLDGFPRRSCITPAGAATKKKITTIEGLAKDGNLHPVQQAFLDAESFQCGYCTSGMILTAAAFLHSNSNPTDEQIRHFMEGNICRCGTYPRIVDAIQRAAKAMRNSGA